jgi:3'(2'), 5'-bisphosphate nucleotidase
VTVPLVSELLAIAREAETIINDVYAKSFGVEYKRPGDPVTPADTRANELICARLAARYPNTPVVAEESDPSQFSGFRSSRRVFFVDPLDGTREFVGRNGQFVVMIGLLDGERPCAGLILAPTSGTAWAGVVGTGAWRIARGGSSEPVQVSPETNLSQARVVLSRSHRGALAQRGAEVLGVAGAELVGSAGLKSAMVADGSADGYVAPEGRGMRWDACAAEALIMAAGGRFTDWDGKLIDYRSETLANERGVLASNSRLHPLLLERLAELRSRPAPA